MSPRKIETFLTRLNGEDFVFDRPQHVSVVRSDGTTAPRNLTPGSYEHSSPAWLPDSSGVVTSGASHGGWDIDLATDLHIVRIDGTTTTITDRRGMYHNPSVSPDGKRIAFVGYDDPLTSPQKGQHLLARLLATADRGRFSRGPEEYRELIETAFDVESEIVRHDLLRVPYTHAIFRAVRKLGAAASGNVVDV